MDQRDNRFYRQADHGMFCPKCGERENIAPHTEYMTSGDSKGQRLTGKNECRNCANIF